ncbi:TetR/AcrR family transcriptional regulator [Actinomadura xylanilytica]|uniref:TetR/AcrR family transcriptional regulator n=1 Tax=Actinomadura xylanilytica TaxID=887459 RepID=UPI00255B191D|nr:TetR/AcrR family transcriptional regulator [Actinomadura xylanilytica]MDL4772996.1 TetR/AcrR family transcriptional regulator [Actinomadura xylanilytica]
MTEPRTGPGRPRDHRLDARVLEATRDLLVAEGYQATTMRAVARRAGVVVTSIYRRWPDKTALVEDAIFKLDLGATPAATGDLRADLLAWARVFLAYVAHPAARTAIPGLLSVYRDQEGYRRLLEHGELPARQALRAVIDAAAGTGQAHPDCDREAIFDLLRGATIVRALTQGTDDADAFCEQITDALMAVARGPCAK